MELYFLASLLCGGVSTALQKVSTSLPQSPLVYFHHCLLKKLEWICLLPLVKQCYCGSRNTLISRYLLYYSFFDQKDQISLIRDFVAWPVVVSLFLAPRTTFQDSPVFFASSDWLNNVLNDVGTFSLTIFLVLLIYTTYAFKLHQDFLFNKKAVIHPPPLSQYVILWPVKDSKSFKTLLWDRVESLSKNQYV